MFLTPQAESPAEEWAAHSDGRCGSAWNGQLAWRPALAPRKPVVAAEEFHGHGVDAAVGDPWIQVGIDLLLALDGAERRQFVADHVQLEVAAFTFDFHLGSRNLLFQEILNFYGLHVQPRSAPDAHGRPSYKKARSLRTPALRHLGSVAVSSRAAHEMATDPNEQVTRLSDSPSGCRRRTLQWNLSPCWRGIGA